MGQNYDAIVIGCGPAGATAAALLAAKGRRVVVLEREKFPRYHIGESLIPYTYFPLERLGLIERMKGSHFTGSTACSSSARWACIPSDLLLPAPEARGRQHVAVLRGEFDQVLMDNAREKAPR